MPLRRLSQSASLLFAVLLCLPVLVVLGSWLQWDATSAQILREMAATVLPDYVVTTVGLCLLVGVGVVVVGSASAAAVTLFEFPGRRTFEWALLLPLAMPAYVVAYAYTDFLQFGGPLQNAIRAATGLQGRMLPEVRSLAGAAWVFTFSLYPYVYLLARGALSERAGQLMEAARLLGAPWRRRIREVALPLARPAVAAGAALALMETLADFGVSSYFGIQTFTAGIYKAWLAMDNRLAAAQLATMLLALVALLLHFEQQAQKRARFVASRGGRSASADAQPVQLRGKACLWAWLVCGVPVLMGFVLPVLFMLRPLAAEWDLLAWGKFLEWSGNSLRLGLITALLAVAIALGLARCGDPHRGAAGRTGVCSSRCSDRGGPVVAGGLDPVGCAVAGRGLFHDRHIDRTGLGLPGAFLCGGLAVGAKRLHAHSAELRRFGPHAGRRQLAPDGAGALAAAAAFHRCGRLAGVCRRHEGTAGHTGFAPVRFRHTGGGGLSAGPRRAPG